MGNSSGFWDLCLSVHSTYLCKCSVFDVYMLLWCKHMQDPFLVSVFLQKVHLGISEVFLLHFLVDLAMVLADVCLFPVCLLLLGCVDGASVVSGNGCVFC